MPRLRAAAGLLGTLMLGGCTAATETPDGVGYVLLDGEAHRSATIAQDGWRGAPVLPLALDTSEPLIFESGDTRTPIELRPGMLAHVKGAAGAVEWLAVGSDIRDDRFLVHAGAQAAEDLAQRLAGEASARGDGLWNITAADVLDRTSYLDAPAGILEALPDSRLDLGDVAAEPPPRGAILCLSELGDLAGAREAASREAALVGFYAAGKVTLLLDASGGFTMADRCTGETTRKGTFRAVGDRVVLQSDDAAPLVLGREGETLLHPGGAVLAPWMFEGNLNGRGEP